MLRLSLPAYGRLVNLPDGEPFAALLVECKMEMLAIDLEGIAREGCGWGGMRGVGGLRRWWRRIGKIGSWGSSALGDADHSQATRRVM